jgi:hypothetical protein
MPWKPKRGNFLLTCIKRTSKCIFVYMGQFITRVKSFYFALFAAESSIWWHLHIHNDNFIRTRAGG